jgi:predicted acylesterase/phospholipase RssA
MTKEADESGVGTPPIDSSDIPPQSLLEIAVGTARSVISGDVALPPFKDVKRTVRELKRGLEFGLSRKFLNKVLETAPDRTNRVFLTQQLALCTYKDEELLPSQRFDDALTLLQQIGLCNPEGINPHEIDPSTLPETLGLGGGVYKRKWEYDGQIENLQQALIFYLAAWQYSPRVDMGYGGVNAAFTLDLLASRARVIARRTGTTETEAQRLADKARELRLQMLKQVPEFAAEKKQSGEYSDIDHEYWFHVTMAEICFGLGDYQRAGDWLAKARQASTEKPEQEATWELQTTFRQLVLLARAQDVDLLDANPTAEAQAAKAALQCLLGIETEAALSCYRGRVGLALSGGGFRASLFHIGVLARLAEVDALRTVEVLSTVSGGSIVGAIYYLEVRKLLRNTSDADIRREHYIEIVRKVQENFIAGVRQNLRMRVLSSLPANIRMLFGRSYSRSTRMGELYESHIYSRVLDGHDSEKQRCMSELLVSPAGFPAPSEFKPRFHNWKRRAKVPVLLLNASLNSGHSWQFTARWMGEPPGLVGQEVDVNERYRRLWYSQAPKPALQNYRLGYAVAASACVPGLFDPLVITDLYPGRTVRLVDGGVHDNQGVEALLNEGCTFLFCSDVSGQMGDSKRPADSIIGVSLRSNSVLQSRIRESEYQGLRARVDSRAIQGLFFVHLKKGLEAAPLDWIDSDDPVVPPSSYSATTDYKVDKDLQRKLAMVRTDLDSFTEVEAYTLMLDGYLMTDHQLRELNRIHQAEKEAGQWGGFDIEAKRDPTWPFLQLESLIRQPPDSSDARRGDLGCQIAVSSCLAFKVWRLRPTLAAIAALLAVAGLVALSFALAVFWKSVIQVEFSVSKLVITLVLALAAIAIPAVKWLQPREAMQSFLARAAVALGGFVLCNIHLWTFDRLYLSRGKLSRLLRLR